ncbi:hypothetical protein B0H13DRAFT_1866192 [Mycena leptocephala]|nr:hypothetical protein B0H13DRAFT_1866192 [Mycena leptocephala]
MVFNISSTACQAFRSWLARGRFNSADSPWGVNTDQQPLESNLYLNSFVVVVACNRLFPNSQYFIRISTHSSRWQELNFGLTSTVVELRTSLRERLSSLKKLWIQWYGPESQSAVHFINCFESASSLVDFGVYNESRFIPVAHPIFQLTRYQLDGPWEEHKRILKLAPNLVEADITVDFDDESWRGVNKIIGFPDATKMMQKLPSITDFGIAIDEYDARGEINLLMSALTVSQVAGSTVVAPPLVFGCEDDSYIDYAVYLEMLKSRWRAEDCTLKMANGGLYELGRNGMVNQVLRDYKYLLDKKIQPASWILMILHPSFQS